MAGSESDNRGDTHSGRAYPIMMAQGWRPPLALLGIRRENAYAKLDGEELEIRAGRLFRARIPLSRVSLTRAGARRRMCHFGVCVRQAEGLALVASGRGVVEMALSEPVEARLMGQCVRFSNLAISLEDAEEFVGEIHRRQQGQAANQVEGTETE